MDKTQKIRYKRWYSAHKEEIKKKKASLARELYKRDPKKYQLKSSIYYQKHRMEILKKQKQKCREKVNAYARNYRRIHPFRVMASMTNSRCKDKITAVDLWSIAKKQKMICYLSGDKLTRDNISIDHIIPISRGGKNIISNIRLTTLMANMARKDLTDEVFIELCQKIIDRKKVYDMAR